MPAQQPFGLIESGAHGVAIVAVNEAAAHLGIEAGTSLTDARAAHPTLLSRPAEPEKDRIALLKLARWAGRYGPNRHIDGSDGLWIDITGVAHLFGGEENLLDDMTQHLMSFGVAVQAGLADTLGAAHALARFGCPPDAAWAMVPAGETREAIRFLPVEALRLDAPRILLLKRLGLRHIGQLYDIPRDSLARRFRSSDAAAAVLVRLDQALGMAEEPRRPMQPPPVLSVARAFAEPLISSEALEAFTHELAGELAAALAAKDLGVQGDLWPVQEQSMLSLIHQRLESMEASGQLAEMQTQFKERVVQNTLRPKPVEGLQTDTRSHTHRVDPTVSVTADMADQNGRIFARKGQRINPLDTVSLAGPLYFLDADDERQVAWFKQQPAELNRKVILVGGNIRDATKALNTRIYFDQDGTLSRRFGLTWIPAVVRQDGSSLVVTSAAMPEGKS